MVWESKFVRLVLDLNAQNLRVVMPCFNVFDAN